MSDLIDLLGAMADYFKARDALNAAMDAYDGYSFDHYGRSYIEDAERALARVQAAWDRALSHAALDAPPF